MSDNEIRVAIAGTCGQKWESHPAEWRGEGNAKWLKPQFWTLNGVARPMLEAPDYPNDLNAMAEARATLDATEQVVYGSFLYAITGAFNHETQQREGWKEINATARQHAEAFLKTRNLWKP